MLPSLRMAFVIFVAALIDIRGSEAQQAPYPDPPQVLVDEVGRGVDAVLDAETDGDASPASEFESMWNTIFLDAVTDAVERSAQFGRVTSEAGEIVRSEVDNSPVTIRKVATYNYMAASSRTDKQIGATSSASGTTTLIEKPSFSSLISFAVEHGAIEQEENGTALTLSTTPYMAAYAFAEDTADNYARYGFLDRLGLSGTFALDSSNNEMGDDLKAEDFSSFSSKLRLIGDRSTRAATLHDTWIAEIQPAIQKRLVVRTAAMADLFNRAPALNQLREDLGENITDQLAAVLKSKKNLAREEKKAELEKTVFTALRQEVLERITAAEGDPRRIEVEEALRQGLKQHVANLIESHEILAKAEARLAEIIAEHQRSPLLSVGYTLNRMEEGTDFSEASIVYEGTVAEFDIVGNFSIGFNHDSNERMDQETLRDFGGGLLVERPFANFVTHFVDQGSSAPVTASLAGRVSRVKDTDRTIGSVQLRFDIPIGAAYSIPVSLSYATATEGSDDSEFRANFGGTFDAEKLAAFAGLAGLL